jgi:hypothetical protein
VHDNGGHNPVAEFDVDVSNDAIGDLGSWLGSSGFCASKEQAVRTALGTESNAMTRFAID